MFPRLVPALGLLLLVACTEPGGPRPERVEPSSAGQGVATQVEIKGSGFEPVFMASYRTGGQSEIRVDFLALLGPHPLHDVERRDNETLTATVPSTLAVGSYELKVVGPDGLEADLADAFTVLPGQVDAGSDAGIADLIFADLEPADAGQLDLGALDATSPDLVVTDAPLLDTEQLDAGLPDTIAPDTTQADTNLPDTNLSDTNLPDTTQPDAGTPPDWHDTDWRCRANVGFDTTALGSEDLIDFPALVVLPPSWPGYARSEADGADLRAVSASQTLLPHEIEEWNPGGTSVIWVGLPSLPRGSTSEYIYFYFDNNAVGDTQDPAAVWANSYEVVLHLNQDLEDSTANANHGTNRGTTQTQGYLAGGRHFVFADENEIAIGDTNLPMGQSARSICAWASPANLSSAAKYWFISYGEFTGDGGFFIGRVGNDLWCGGVGDDIIAPGYFDIDVWGYHCCVVQANRDVLLYSAGVLVHGPERHNNWSVAPGEALVGGHINPGAAEYWDGDMDEVRISSVDRSADWILAEFLAMDGALATLTAPECLD